MIIPTINLIIQPYDQIIPTIPLSTPTIPLSTPTIDLFMVILYPPKPAPSIAPSPKTPFQKKHPKNTPTPHTQTPASWYCCSSNHPSPSQKSPEKPACQGISPNPSSTESPHSSKPPPYAQ